MAQKGKVTEWYVDKGYGYIVPESEAIRIKFLLKDVKNSVNVGQIRQPVRFVITNDEQGNRRASKIEGMRPFPWGILVTVWFFASLVGCVLFWQYPAEVLYYYIAMSLLILLVYMSDKRSEKRNKSITGESSILFISLLGGWPGNAIGQYSFNLKPKSAVFKLLLFFVVLAHIGLIAWTLTPSGTTELHQWVGSGMELIKKN